MSGFERSAPIPGSQGPRRSQMLRFNNAPPPMTPWRQEVLEAQRQIRSKGSRSRSRSRSRPKKPKEAARKPEVDVQANPGAVLRTAREHGEGWYAAVAKAAQNWDTVHGKRAQQEDASAPAVSAAPASSKKKEKDRDKDKEKHRKGEASRGSGVDPEVARRREADRRRQEEEQREQERQRSDFEVKAEERRLRAEEERRKVEADRRRLEQAKKERQARLKGAFAVDDDDDDEEDLARRARGGRGSGGLSRAEAPLGAVSSTAVVAAVLPSQLPAGSIVSGGAAAPNSSAVFDPVFSEKVGFEKGLSPAEAFMRLQERKRKGRATEFGGPPRGCSPWRDGKRGITYDKADKHERSRR